MTEQPAKANELQLA